MKQCGYWVVCLTKLSMMAGGCQILITDGWWVAGFCNPQNRKKMFSLGLGKWAGVFAK